MIPLLLSMGFWGCMVLKNVSAVICFGILFSLYLYYHSRKIVVVFIWFFLCLFSLTFSKTYVSAQPGVYQIIEIKKSYVLATNHSTTIVMYNIDSPNYYDQYEVTSFSTIHSIHNENQFSFQEYLNNRNIYESADTYKCVSKSNSIRSILFSKLSKNEYYALYFYGIYNEDEFELVSRLSIPIITLLNLIESRMYSKTKKMYGTFFSILCAIVFGVLFTFKISLVRFIIFKLGKLLFDQWEHSFSFSLFLFLILNPYEVTNFVLVFYSGIQISQHISKSKKVINVIQRLFIIFCQFFYFHQIDVTFTLAYTYLRYYSCFIFVLSLVGFNLPVEIQYPTIYFYYVPSLIYTLIFLLSVYYLIKRNKKYLLCIVCFLIIPFVEPHCSPFFHVYMLDIGQGDCTLIVEPFQKSVIMIDCGQNLNRDNVQVIVLPFLNSIGIHRIDYLIVTHDDFDHSGGVESLMKNINVGQVIEDRQTQIDVCYPFYSLLVNRDVFDKNDESIVNFFSYDSINYLWTGDASIQIENQLLENYILDVDILKLGHHGSQTSSSQEFLDALRPKIALISVGYKNKYNHPSNNVVKTCYQLGIEVLETKDVGMIHIFTWHGIHMFSCANGIVGIF